MNNYKNSYLASTHGLNPFRHYSYTTIFFSIPYAYITICWVKLTIRWLGTVLLLNWSILPIDLLCFYMVLLSADKFNQTCSHIVTEQIGYGTLNVFNIKEWNTFRK